MTTDSKASDVNAKLIADLRALQSALYYGHELTGDEAPLLDLVIDILEARASQQPSAQWIAIGGAKDLPIGQWLVLLEAPMLGRHVHSATAHPNHTVIGARMAWDAPHVIAYAPIPH